MKKYINLPKKQIIDDILVELYEKIPIVTIIKNNKKNAKF